MNEGFPQKLNQERTKMARKKSQQLQDLSTQVLTTLQASTEFDGKDFSIDGAGAITFKRGDEVFRVKASKINGPRSKKADTLDTEMNLS